MSSKRGSTHLEEELRVAVRTFSSSLSSTGPVVGDMSALIRATLSLPLSNLAYWERSIRDEHSLARRAYADSRARGWRALFSFTGAKERAEPGSLLTWIDLSSHDGYVRERTLRTLSGAAPNSFFLALAARRLNDWVPQVRAAAREAIPKLARTSDPENVVDALCAMLPAWTSWGRMEEMDKQVMAELTSIDPVAELLTHRLISSAAGPMSSVLSQALRSAFLDENLAKMATDAIQPAVRARAYRALLVRKAVWVEGRKWQWTDVRYCLGRLNNVFGERPLTVRRPPVLMELLDSAATDPSPVVRRVAAEALVREMSNLGSSALPLARKFAGDTSPSVAERGVFVLQRLAAHSG